MPDMRRPRVLIFVGGYLPGFKYGGPIRSIAGIVERLSDRWDFWIITADRDLKDPEPYPGIPTETWVPVGKAHVCYLPPEAKGLLKMQSLIESAEPDLVYLTSYFHDYSLRYVLLRRLGLIETIPCVLSPRSELMPEMLQIKARKKSLFNRIVIPLNLYNDIVWHATSAEEVETTPHSYPHAKCVMFAPNLPSSLPVTREEMAGRPAKEAGKALFVSTSRLSSKKNLPLAIEMLSQVKGEVEFRVFGSPDTAEDEAAIRGAIDRFTSETYRPIYGGPVSNDRVRGINLASHFFVSPTTGENFGHAILEALTTGCPLVLSDKTPWRGLESKKAGWDLSLDDKPKWIEVLQRCVDMGPEEYATWQNGAWRLAHDWADLEEIENATDALFRKALYG